MKANVRLRRMTEAAPIAAMLVPTEDVPFLLQLVARAGGELSSRVFRVRSGFLVKLDQPCRVAMPGVIRLRRLAYDLFLPADAELLPALLDDEAADLTRLRGLVFLPGRVLAFEPDRPVSVGALLDPGVVRRDEWGPLPERKPYAERIREIGLDLPPVPPDDILDASGEDIGSDVPRPQQSGPMSRAAGGASMGLGRALHWLGHALNAGSLAALGARLVSGGLGLAPRLSEALLGQQEAALRELLRQFREGNLEQALRRALPIGGIGRGAVPYTSHQLPTHDTRFSLRSLLGDRGGPASVWFGGGDVQLELSREYRKAAEEATSRGDYRRAAFIYGRLLDDYRLAADVLFRGGLFHDAAVLYQEKLGDDLGAAKAFAAAGEIDRAVEIYRRKGEHLLAGDLLRRAGEDEEAQAEYQIAADLLVTTRQDYLGAGNLMLDHAANAERARNYFAAGWALCLRSNSVPCGKRLAWLYATGGETEKLLKLLSEAENFFALPGDNVAAGDFFNEIARLADRKPVAAIRDELRDRALLGIAAKLRDRARNVERPGTVISDMLGLTPVWAPPVVREAAFAFSDVARRRPKPVVRETGLEMTRIHLGRGTVTAACHAPESGDVFLGFASGEVVCVRPESSQSVSLPPLHVPVHSLACDATGQFLAILRSHDLETGELDAFVRNLGTAWLAQRRTVRGHGNFCLSSLIALHEGEHVLGLHDGERLVFLRGSTLLPEQSADLPVHSRGISAILLLGVPNQFAPALAPFVISYDAIYRIYPAGGDPRETSLGARPSLRLGSPLRAVPLAWRQPRSTSLELAGLTEDGSLFCTALEWKLGWLDARASARATPVGGYRAVAFARSGLLAAVTVKRIDWLRWDDNRLSVWRETRTDLPGAVACFPGVRTQEVIVILEDSEVVRVSIPS